MRLCDPRDQAHTLPFSFARGPQEVVFCKNKHDLSFSHTGGRVILFESKMMFYMGIFDEALGYEHAGRHSPGSENS